MSSRVILVAGLAALTAACTAEEEQAAEPQGAATYAPSVSLPAPTEAAYRGGGLARQVCAQCHHVTGGEAPPDMAAESFIDIANREDVSEESLRDWLKNADHPNMPNYILSDEAVGELTEYILYLRGLN